MTDEDRKKMPASHGREAMRKPPPPGEGEGLEEASSEAVEEMEKRAGTGHAGTGDIG